MVLSRLCYALHSINAYMLLVGKEAVDTHKMYETSDSTKERK